MKGCIFKRGPSAWLIKYDIGKDPATGKRRQKYKTVHGSRADAEREKRELLGQIDKGTYVEPKTTTLESWIEKWLSEYAEPSVSAKTLERYQQLLRVHVIPHIGKKPIQKVSIPDVHSLYVKLRKEGLTLSKKQTAAKLEKKWQEPATPVGLSEATILHVHRALSLVFSEATRSQVISRNPVSEMKAPRPKRGETEESGQKINALDQEQVNSLVSGLANHPLRSIVAFALSTGMRRGEILALRWTDLDFEKLTVRVDRALEETQAKGLRFKAPKNKASRRTIGIDAEIVSILKEHRKRQLEDLMKLGTRLPSDALVFPISILEPAKPMPTYSVSKRFSEVAERIGFPGFRFHDLRHTHATLLLTAGVPVNAVAARLGHSTPVITLSVYGHVLKRAEEQAAAVAGSILRGAVNAPKT